MLAVTACWVWHILWVWQYPTARYYNATFPKSWPKFLCPRGTLATCDILHISCYIMTTLISGIYVVVHWLHHHYLAIWLFTDCIMTTLIYGICGCTLTTSLLPLFLVYVVVHWLQHDYLDMWLFTDCIMTTLISGICGCTLTTSWLPDFWYMWLFTYYIMTTLICGCSLTTSWLPDFWYLWLFTDYIMTTWFLVFVIVHWLHHDYLDICLFTDCIMTTLIYGICGCTLTTSWLPDLWYMWLFIGYIMTTLICGCSLTA